MSLIMSYLQNLSHSRLPKLISSLTCFTSPRIAAICKGVSPLLIFINFIFLFVMRNWEFSLGLVFAADDLVESVRKKVKVLD